MIIDGLKKGSVLVNEELVNIFRCGPQGGMRRSKKTNSLVLISHSNKKLYREVFQTEDGLWNFTGMGQEGPQSLEYMQNKTLLNSNQWNIDVYLFQVLVEGKYTYIGKVRLAGNPYQDIQKDRNGKDRKAWIFPLIEVNEEENISSFLSTKFNVAELRIQRVFHDDQCLLQEESVSPLIRLMKAKNVDTLTGPGGWYLSSAGFYHNPNAQELVQKGSIEGNEIYVFMNQNSYLNPFDEKSLVKFRDSQLNREQIEDGIRIKGFSYQDGKKTTKIAFLPDDTELNNDKTKPFTTLLIGPNGTGKSTHLAYLQAIFNDIYETSQSIMYRTLDPEITYDVEYYAGNTLYRVKRHNENGENRIQVWVNGINESFRNIAHPEKLIVVSFTISDRFLDIKDQDRNSPVEYLGVRNMITKSNKVDPSYQLVQNLLNAASEDNFLGNLSVILDFIQVQKKIRLLFYTKENRSFGDLLNEKSLSEMNEHARFIFDPHELIAIYSDRNGLFADETVFQFSETTLGIEFDLSDPEKYELFTEEFAKIQSLMELGILDRSEVYFLKDEYFELNEASSGESQYISTMINIITKIEKNSIVLIDEPETSLHPNWQNQYIYKLKNLFQNFWSCHFVLATHSHFMVADLEQNSSTIVSLTRDDNQKVVSKLHDSDTFGWSVEDVLLNIFDLPTNRNLFFAEMVDRLLMDLALRSMDGSTYEIYNRVLEMQEKLKDNDPLKRVITLIKKRVERHE